MNINKKTGLLDENKYISSPNADERPDGMNAELIVIHNISLPPGQFGGPYISQLFNNQLNPTEHPYFAEIANMQVSAHVLIRRDGELIQYVPFHRRAWHAGESSYCGRAGCNDFSIGIELEGTDEQSYESVQYQQLANLINALRNCYPTIAKDAITGHCDIAPTRKTDPGPEFDWQRLKKQLNT